MDAKQMGMFISKLRKENNMTQAQLAKELHVSDKAVSRWERGLGFPDINTIEPLAEALNVNILELMQCQRMPTKDVQVEVATDAVNTTLDIVQQQKKIELRNMVMYSIVGIVGTFCLLIGLAFHSYDSFSLLSRPILSCFIGMIMLLVFLSYLYRKINKSSRKD